MMNELHELLLDRRALVHLSCTGAGANLLTRIWEQPGASTYLVGSSLPYGSSQLTEHLGYKIDGSCCSQTVAIELATSSFVMAAQHRALAAQHRAIVGVGVTAAVASGRIPRGEQRAHLVVMTEHRVLYRLLKFQKDRGIYARRQHDARIADATVELLVETLCGTDRAGEDVADLALDLLFEHPSFEVDGTRGASTERSSELYLPGSFNPLHDGHRAMCDVAESNDVHGRSVRYLVGADPVHKTPLSVQALLDVAGQVRGERQNGRSRAIEFSRRDPLFVDKAKLRPGATFVIGADAMQTMLDPKWGQPASEVLHVFRTYGIRFLVMGRDIGGRFTSCDSLDVPPDYADLFTTLQGRVDLSSSELRRQRLDTPTESLES